MELLDDDEAGWGEVAALLGAGRVVAVPTDTVYGVAAPVSMPGVVARLFPLKSREVSKPVAVLVASLEQAAELVAMSPLSDALAERWWPGALTMVLPRLPSFEVDLGGAGDTVGVRCPAHDGVRRLCELLGPLATTSANRSGRATPSSGAEVAAALAGTEVAAVLDAGHLDGVASTVVRVDLGELHVLRPGPIDAVALSTVAREVR